MRSAHAFLGEQACINTGLPAGAPPPDAAPAISQEELSAALAGVLAHADLQVI